MMKSWIIAALMLGLAAPAVAGQRYPAAESAKCTQHFAEAEAFYGIPHGLLRAVALTESAVRLDDGTTGPWPWTLNISNGTHEGIDKVFANQEEAVAFAKTVHQRSVDFGCMQVNRKWDGFPIESEEARLEPRNNVMWAAYELAALRQSTGSWGEAVGRYHAGDRGPGTQTEAWRQSGLEYTTKVDRYLASANN